jgi:hypothetical protein
MKFKPTPIIIQKLKHYILMMIMDPMNNLSKRIFLKKLRQTPEIILKLLMLLKLKED